MSKKVISKINKDEEVQVADADSFSLPSSNDDEVDDETELTVPNQTKLGAIPSPGSTTFGTSSSSSSTSPSTYVQSPYSGINGLFGSPTLPTLTKLEPLKATDPVSFSKWKEIFEAYCQTNKISNIVFLPANQSYALAVQKNYGNKPIDQLTDMYKSVHESVFGLLTTAVVEKTGSSIIVELKDSQQLKPGSFIYLNANLYWKKICEMYEIKSSLSSIPIYRKLLSLRYTNGSNPRAFKKEFDSLLEKLRDIKDVTLPGQVVPEGFKAMIIMQALPKELDPLMQSFSSKANVRFTDVYDALTRQYDFKINSSTSSSKPTDAVSANALLSSRRNGKRSSKIKNTNSSPAAGSSNQCNHCLSKGHDEDQCWKKHPELRPNPSRPNKQGGSPSTSAFSSCLVESEIIYTGTDEQKEIFSILGEQFSKEQEDENYDQSDVDIAASTVTGELFVGNPTQFMLDSGTTRHITPHKHLLTDIHTISPVRLTSALKSSSAVINSAGSIQLSSIYRLNEVAYVAGAGPNLISEAKIADAGFVIIKNKNCARIQTESGRTVLYFPRVNKLWIYSLPTARAYKEKPSITRIAQKSSAAPTSSVPPVVHRTIPQKNGNTASTRSKSAASPRRNPARSTSTTVVPTESASTIARRLLDEARSQSATNAVYFDVIREMNRAAAHETTNAAFFSPVTPQSNSFDILAAMDTTLEVDPVTSQQVVHLSKAQLWHSRLGHQHSAVLANSNIMFKLGVTQKDLNHFHNCVCESCALGKSQRAPIGSFADPQYKATDVLGTISVDLVGPISLSQNKSRVRTPTTGGSLYGLSVVDEFSRAVSIVLLKRKSDAADQLIPLINSLQVRTGRVLQRFHSDGGGEFVNEQMKSFFTNNGTRITHTTAHTPQHNGIVERMNRTLFDMVRSMMIHSQAPSELWGEALIWAAHVHNSTPQSSINNQTPFQLLFNYRFDLNKLRVFGCDAYVHNPQSKIQSKRWKGIFIGYDQITNSYRIMNIHTKHVCRTNDVRFDEQSFTCCKLLVDNAVLSDEHLPPSDSLNHTYPADAPSEEEETPSEVLDDVVAPLPQVNEPDTVDEAESIDINTEEAEVNRTQPSPSSSFSIPAPVEATPHYVSRSGRVSVPVSYYGKPSSGDYEGSYHVGFTDIKEVINSAYSSAFVGTEPNTYKQAVNMKDSAEWTKEMKNEINSLQQQKVWDLVTCPRGIKPITGRWVFKYKLGDKNNLVRRKARFVAKGFLQVHGRDYLDTHSPVAKMKSIKLLLAIAAEKDLELKQLDFDTAFLNAKVEEDIYIKQPDGFHQGVPDVVCKLNKALYGLKQASREWNKEIDSFMVSIGYQSIKSDPCVYTKTSKSGNKIIICLYVDDTIIGYHKIDEAEWNHDKSLIAGKYAIKDLGNCDWILNMRVSRNRSTKRIMLCQEAYVKRIIQQYRMDTAKPATNPEKYSDLNFPLDGTTSIPLSLDQKEYYQSIVGALLYAANTTRVDIAHVVGQLSRFVAAPQEHQLDAAKHVLRYLASTTNYGMVFNGTRTNNQQQLVTVHSNSSSPVSLAQPISAFTDASWGNDLADRRSTTGTVIKYNGNVISWLSKKQDTIALSSTEAEYMALSTATTEVLWYKAWIREVLGLEITVPIYCDNQSAIEISSNDCYHQRTKHIDIRHHFIRDHITKKHVQVQWVPTAEQQADLLTKMLGTRQFTILRDKLLSVT